MREDITAGFTKLDRSVRPVDSFTGGTHAALQAAAASFVSHELADYEETRNHPETAGNQPAVALSALRQHRAADHCAGRGRGGAAGQGAGRGRDRFLDQLIGWRELAVLFVRHKPNYDNWECAAPWARKTLLEHAGDPRPYRYSFEATGARPRPATSCGTRPSARWSQTGWMHNYMRMYWAKKILEWAPDPAAAFDGR